MADLPPSLDPTPACTRDRAADMLHAVLSARDARVGVTPRQLVWRKNKAQFYRFTSG